MNISTQNLIDLNGSVQLKPGQRMVRVSGSTWMPVGVGGNFIPGASQGTGGTSAEYYKCASVSTDVQVVDGKTLTVSNAIWMDTYNGTYTLQDENATGKDRVWQHSDKQHQLRYLTDISRWSFVYILDTTWADYRCYADTDNPWDNLTYISGQTQEEQVLSIQPSVTTSPGNMWSGYKAVFDSGTGTWSFESDVTAGLTYTSVTPIVGGIYSADALAVVSLLYTGVPNLTSPTGMTSNSSDEWEISASSFYNNNSPPWKAFDGITSDYSGWTGASSSAQWIQWRNKNKQVLVQRLRFMGTSAQDIAQQAIKSFVLQGSNDGNVWFDLCTASGLTWSSTGYEWKEFSFPNNKSYYYYRLYNIIVASNYPTIIELETYDM